MPENKISIGVENKSHWKCRACDKRQEFIDDEEWPYHCNETMEMKTAYKLFGMSRRGE